MSRFIFNLETPPDELEISRAILLSGENVGEVIRRLAYQRDQLLEKLKPHAHAPVDAIQHGRPIDGLPPGGGSDAH